MQTDHFFHWIGTQLGQLIRALVDGLAWIFGNLYTWIDSFIGGLTAALGISPSLFSVVVIVIGLLLLYAGLRALLHARMIGALVWAALGVFVLSWLIR